MNERESQKCEPVCLGEVMSSTSVDQESQDRVVRIAALIRKKSASSLTQAERGEFLRLSYEQENYMFQSLQSRIKELEQKESAEAKEELKLLLADLERNLPTYRLNLITYLILKSDKTEDEEEELKRLRIEQRAYENKDNISENGDPLSQKSYFELQELRKKQFGGGDFSDEDGQRLVNLEKRLEKHGHIN